jgi:hypothetical protein
VSIYRQRTSRCVKKEQRFLFKIDKYKVQYEEKVAIIYLIVQFQINGRHKGMNYVHFDIEMLFVDELTVQY